MFFLFLHEKICCWYSLEVPWQGTSNEYHNICFLGEVKRYPHFWLKKSDLSGAKHRMPFLLDTTGIQSLLGTMYNNIKYPLVY